MLRISSVGGVICGVPGLCSTGCAAGKLSLSRRPHRPGAAVGNQRNANQHDHTPNHADPDVPVCLHMRGVRPNDGV